MKENSAYSKLINKGIHPSVQRLAIMDYLISHNTHPTIEEIFSNLSKVIPTLSRTTVYNTLRLFSEHQAATMITIDDHHVCYDGTTDPHPHFYCKSCGKIMDMQMENVTCLTQPKNIDGNSIDEVQVYYKGICKECQQKLSFSQ